MLSADGSFNYSPTPGYTGKRLFYLSQYQFKQFILVDGLRPDHCRESIHQLNHTEFWVSPANRNERRNNW